MKIKYILPLCMIFLCFLQTEAQKTIPIPKAKEFEEYLYNRLHGIQVKLYNLALAGRIKAYRSDSLVSVYSVGDIKSRVKSEFMVDKKWVKIPFSDSDILGIWILEKVNQNPLEMQGSSELLGIAPLFQPSYYGVMSMPHPIFWISATDLKLALDKDEQEFLSLMYYYGRNSNYIWDDIWKAENPYDDAFLDLNNSNRLWISPDSTFYIRLSSMLTYSCFYLHHFLRYPIAKVFNYSNGKYVAPADPAFIFDEHQNKYITINELQAAYFIEEELFISTDPNDPTIGVDTLIRRYMEIYSPDAVSIDIPTGKISKYHFYPLKITYHDSFPEKVPGINTYKFYIDASVNRGLPSVQPIIWFYEDYIRWKKL